MRRVGTWETGSEGFPPQRIGAMALRREDATTVLEDNHRELQQLLREFEATGAATAIHRQQQILGMIRQEIVIHAAIEEEIYYPGVRSAAEEAVAASIEARQLTNRTLGEIVRQFPSPTTLA